jgi:glutamate dehydrogenase (NAD(P)+)
MGRSRQKQTITSLPGGVPIIPDFLCNAGGVIFSYFEIVQNRNLDHWEKDRVQSRMMMTMTDTYRRAAGMAKENNMSLRRAAYSIAMEQVVEAMEARGGV